VNQCVVPIAVPCGDPAIGQRLSLDDGHRHRGHVVGADYGALVAADPSPWRVDRWRGVADSRRYRWVVDYGEAVSAARVTG
jgi:hypothetical protein